MAKHCDVCNRWYADQFATCPHCAAAKRDKTGRLSESVLHVELMGETGQPPGSESRVGSDLGQRTEPVNFQPSTGSEVNLGAQGRPTHNAPPRDSESEVDIGAPVARMPDTNSGVAVTLPGTAGDSSVVQLAPRLLNVPSPEMSGVRIDSPSDVDLTSPAKGQSDSASVIAQPAKDQQPASDISGIRILPNSGPNVVAAGDSASALHTRASARDESSAVSVGKLREAASGIDSNKSSVNLGAPVRKSKIAADAGLADDASVSGVCLGRQSAPDYQQEESGVERAPVDSGTEVSSSILPEGSRLPGPPAPNPGRRAPQTAHNIGIDEHFSTYDESAVDLGGTAGRPSSPEIESEPGMSGASASRLSTEAAAHDRRGAWSANTQSDVIAEGQEAENFGSKLRHGRPSVKDSRRQFLVGAALGVVLGLAASAGLMYGAPGMLAGLGVEIGKPRATTPWQGDGPGTGQTGMLNANGKEWADRFAGQSAEDVARRIDQLEQEKMDAAKKAADLTEAARAAETQAGGDLANKLKSAEAKAAELLEQVKANETKAAELARRLKADEDKAATLNAALRTAQEAETQAKQQADDEQAAALIAKEQAAKAEAARQEALEEARTLRDLLDKLKHDHAEIASQLKEMTALRKQAGTTVQPSISHTKPITQGPDTMAAESYYASGVQQFWAGAYAYAEEQFLHAIRHDSRDARYHYYLGLSRWSQGKPADARRDFERAAALERQNSPARAAVNAIFERVQGSLRQELDQYRK